MSPSSFPILLSMAAIGQQWAHSFKVSTPIHQLQFKWRNQKQIRKNRRRAHAAGKKNAFQ